MRIFTLLSTVVLSVVSLCVTGQVQHQTEEWFEEYIEEKVRNPKVEAWLIDQRERYMQGLPIEWSTMPKREQSQKPNVNLEKAESTLGSGAEPHIAMHPTNPDVIAISYMEAATQDYPVFYTTDGGTTWTQSSFSPAAELQNQYPGDFVLGGGDPILAYDEDGTLYMTWIYAHGAITGLQGSMFYAYSTDGGVNFTVPAIADHLVFGGDMLASDLLDRQWMMVDNSGGTYDGNLYMSCVYFGGAFGAPAGELVLYKTPSDNGLSSNYTVAVPATGSDATQFGNVAVSDIDGSVHVACMKFDGQSGAGSVVYTKSVDGAQTFATPTTIAAATTALPNSQDHVVHSRDNSATSLAVDGDNVYIAWSDMANADVHSYYAYSNDGGATWSQPVEFGEDVLNANYYHLMPNLAADSGRVTVSWYAVDRTTSNSDYYVVESPDGGVSLGAPAIISGGSTDFTGATGSQDFYGDYNASVRSGCNTWSVWGDGRTGAPVTYVAKTNTCNIVAGFTEISALNGTLEVGELYPNPADAVVSLPLSSTQSQGLTIEIFSTEGKLVGTPSMRNVVEGEQTIELNLNDIAAGQYMVKLTTDEGEFATRLLLKR